MTPHRMGNSEGSIAGCLVSPNFTPTRTSLSFREGVISYIVFITLFSQAFFEASYHGVRWHHHRRLPQCPRIPNRNIITLSLASFFETLLILTSHQMAPRKGLQPGIGDERGASINPTSQCSTHWTSPNQKLRSQRRP
jgi:hypothetical protein